MAWGASAGDALVDSGSPTQPVCDGDPLPAAWVGGDSILKAEDDDAAQQILATHPHHEVGTIDVAHQRPLTPQSPIRAGERALAVVARLEADAGQEQVQACPELVDVVVGSELLDDVEEEGVLLRIEPAPLVGGELEEGLSRHTARDNGLGRLLAEVGGGADHEADDRRQRDSPRRGP